MYYASICSSMIDSVKQAIHAPMIYLVKHVIHDLVPLWKNCSDDLKKLLKFVYFPMGGSLLGFSDIKLYYLKRYDASSCLIRSSIDKMVENAPLHHTLNVDVFDIPWTDMVLKVKIGAGSFGTVHRTDWNGEDVAIKILFLEQEFHPEKFNEFWREAKHTDQKEIDRRISEVSLRDLNSSPNILQEIDRRIAEVSSR
ncbi:hypothetical protein L2E82_01650 [Cichorium intybus]|uniref:Uncharacterized protein n=1 Tax=Cichorium intybus TaxID=13427 RepID=A0ACB9H112_CICIN|nr:hypothetical protein L2E82_01650 [Cichorium intybus]